VDRLSYQDASRQSRLTNLNNLPVILMARPSLDINIEHGESVRMAKGFQSQFETSDLHLRKKVMELNAHNMEVGDDGLDSENRDPAVVATDVAAQIVGLRCIFCSSILTKTRNSVISAEAQISVSGAECEG